MTLVSKVTILPRNRKYPPCRDDGDGDDVKGLLVCRVVCTSSAPCGCWFRWIWCFLSFTFITRCLWLQPLWEMRARKMVLHFVIYTLWPLIHFPWIKKQNGFLKCQWSTNARVEVSLIPSTRSCLAFRTFNLCCPFMNVWIRSIYLNRHFFVRKKQINWS